MPEITVIHIAALFVALLIGIVLGWFARGGRSRSEKAAINAGWQEQLQAQRNEHERLLDQNKSLMDQNSQYQASNKDAKMRASELSDALKEAFERRDELQRQIKDIRGNLEVVVGERDQLQNTMDDQAAKDDKIDKLNREIENWQNRVSPLIERFRERNAEAEQLEADLESAREHIAALEGMVGSEHTRVEPVDQEAMREHMEASNDPLEEEPSDEEEPHGEVEASEVEAQEEAPSEEEDALVEEQLPVEEQPLAEDQPSHFETQSTSTNIGIAGDDLKLIKGVGPAIEKTLNEMGIFRFEQIAAMSEYDIDRVARKLKGFHSRIYREDWMGQARALQDQKASGQH